MNSDNNISRLLGAVFLIVAVASILSGTLFLLTIGSGSISDNLVNISNKAMQVRISILIDLITSVGIVVLGILLFIVLQKQNKNMAFVALGCYLAEAIILAVSKISLFSLIPLSLEYIKAGAPASSYFQSLGSIFKDAHIWGYTTHMLFFGLGGILFYCLLHQSKLVPKVLSVWGLIAVSLTLIGTWFMFFNIDLGMIIYMPEGLFEIVIGIWLMLKGFKPYKLNS